MMIYRPYTPVSSADTVGHLELIVKTYEVSNLYLDLLPSSLPSSARPSLFTTSSLLADPLINTFSLVYHLLYCRPERSLPSSLLSRVRDRPSSTQPFSLPSALTSLSPPLVRLISSSRRQSRLQGTLRQVPLQGLRARAGNRCESSLLSRLNRSRASSRTSISI